MTMEKIPPEQLLDRLTRLDNLVALCLQELIAIREKPAAELVLPPGFVSTTVPLDPETLNNLIAAQRLEGICMTPYVRASVLVPAGTPQAAPLSIPFSFPDGWLCTRRSPLEILFTFHHQDIGLSLRIIIGGTKEVVLADSVPGTADFTEPSVLSFGEYYVKYDTDTVWLDLYNESATDTRVTVSISPFLLTREFYERFYKPVIEKGYTTLEELAESISEMREYAGVT